MLTHARDGPRAIDRHLEDVVDLAGLRLHDHDPVGKGDGLVDAVSDEHHGLPEAFPDRQQLALQELARIGVDGSEGLVHQQHLRTEGERAGDADALAHAAGEVVGKRCLEALEPDQLDRPLNLLIDLGLRHAGEDQREGHVLADRLPGEEAELLEHHRRLPRRPADHFAVELDRALVGEDEAVEDAQQRGLAAAARAEQAHEFVLMDLKTDVVQHLKVAVPLRDVARDGLRVRVTHVVRMRCFGLCPSQFPSPSLARHCTQIASGVADAFL